jgi:hypothetical protein
MPMPSLALSSRLACAAASIGSLRCFLANHTILFSTTKKKRFFNGYIYIYIHVHIMSVLYANKYVTNSPFYKMKKKPHPHTKWAYFM